MELPPRQVLGTAGRRLSQDLITRGSLRTLPSTTEAARLHPVQGQLHSEKEEGALVCRAHLSELDSKTRPTAQKGAKHTQGTCSLEGHSSWYQSQLMHKGMAGTKLPPGEAISPGLTRRETST